VQGRVFWHLLRTQAYKTSGMAAAAPGNREVLEFAALKAVLIQSFPSNWFDHV